MCTEKLYTFAEAAELLAVPEATLRKKAASGIAPHRKIFRHTRFNDEDLQAIQQARPVVAAGPGRPVTGATGRYRARPNAPQA